MKYLKSMLLICVIFSLLSLTYSAQRFKDDIMMQKHHNQKNLQTQGTINVHLIPHSHDDVGWLKTVDNYFYGGDQKTQWAGVQYTIDTVVSQMSSNKDYRFSIVQVAFLYRWWNNANQTQRQQMKTLVENGQLQFINGGWCMSDQAAPYYEDVIDQMTIGLRWLKDTFNYVPKVAWHIDPFGHQASSASMFSRMGFQSFFFARIDYQDKDLRLKNKAMEMIWRPLQYTQDKTNYIFTHVNYYHYSPPPGFCYDLKCQNDPVKDDPTMQQYNIIDKSNQLVTYFKSMALHFRSNTLMHTLGQDFHFANARMWYKNFDKLIKYINERPEYGVKLMYSTPGKYIQTIQKEGNSYPTKTDDFFPYADQQNGYWTGYFTSRTGLKGFVRSFGKWIQAVRKHISQLKISGSSQYVKDNSKIIQEKIWGLQMAMGILQHHDGVSGTSKQKVAFDYVNTALRAINEFQKIYRQIKSQQMNIEIGEKISSSDIYFNIFWNQTAKITGLDDKINANKTVLVNLYNSGPKGIYQVRIDVPQHDLNVVGSNGNINGDVLCVDLYDQANCQLVFSLNIQESSNAYVKLVPVKSGGSAKVVKVKQLTILDSSKQFKLTTTSSIKITKSSQKFDLSLNETVQSFLVGYNFYESYQGAGQKSGAYIFRPASNSPKQYSNIKKIHYAEGITSVCIILEGDRTITKLYFSKIPNYIQNYGVQIQTFIDSIPINDNIGKQVTLNIKTNYQNNKTFYTDSNGLEEQKRIINYRPTWDLVVHQPVAGNYYPINSHIRLVDVSTNKNLTLVTERSVGGAVINEGQFQVMIHRRTTHDDSRGVDQPLNEQQRPGVGLTQQVRHYLVFGNNFRTLQKRNDQKIAIFLSPSATSTFAKQAIRNGPLKVPSTVKLFLRPFMDQSYLMRIHNMDTDNSVNVNLINGWQVTQYTLSANQLLEDWQKSQYKWNQDKTIIDINEEPSTLFESIISQGQKIKNYFSPKFNKEQQSQMQSNQFNDSTLVLRPFQIRTFKLTKTTI